MDSENRISTGSNLEPPSGLKGWLIEQVRKSDYGLLTRTEILELAARDGKSGNSLSIYMTYACELAHDRAGSFFYPVGERPSDDQIEQALPAIRRSKLKSDQEWAYDNDKGLLTLDLLVGHSVLNGVIILKPADEAYLEILGDKRFRILDLEGEQHGNLSVSWPMRAVIGLSTYFSHKAIEPGDEIVISIEIETGLARCDR